MFKRPNYKGKLIVVEGIDGSGKSTQIDLLYKWLQAQGKTVYFSEWNSSDLVKSTTRLGKDKKMFTPTTFSLLQSTDFCERWENYMLPLLKAGAVVQGCWPVFSSRSTCQTWLSGSGRRPGSCR